MDVIREALRLTGIVKKFGAVEANERVSLSVGQNSLHAIVGENGTGKSTIARLAYGMLSPDEGEPAVNGRPVRFSSPKEAIAAGTGMVRQHFILVPVMTLTGVLGFRGIAAALLAGTRPLWILPAAFFFGLLELYGGLAFGAYVPKDISMIMQAVVILMVISLGAKNRRSSIRKSIRYDRRCRCSSACGSRKTPRPA